MLTTKKSRILRNLVLCFGFMEGLWVAVGINPEGAIIQSISRMLTDLGVELWYVVLLFVLPLIGLVVTLLWVYDIGRWEGIAAVTISFCGGLFILSQPVIGVLLVGIALLITSLVE